MQNYCNYFTYYFWLKLSQIIFKEIKLKIIFYNDKLSQIMTPLTQKIEGLKIIFQKFEKLIKINSYLKN